MKTKLTFLTLLVFAALSLSFQPILSLAQNTNSQTKQDDKAKKQKRQKFELKSQTAEVGRGESTDPKIKQERPVEDPNSPAPAPPNKGGTTRGGNQGVCEVKFDSYVGYYIDLYVDGSYRGTLSPHGATSIFTYSGPTTVYARTRTFSNGSYLYWGEYRYNCYDGQYIDFTMK